MNLRAQLKATPIKRLKDQVNKDNELIGAFVNTDYLNLEDGKTVKIRIFPAHPGVDNFYIPKRCYWLSVMGNDGNMRRVQVLDSRMHGGTKYDLVNEYAEYARRKWAKDSDKLNILVGTGPNSNSLNPQYSWLCYADRVSPDNAPLKAKVWEFKKMVRDALNKLAFSEDDEEAIEIDPFTDPDEGLPILVKYLKNPNKKKGETYYEVSFPKKPAPRALTDEEVEQFLRMKPLPELLPKYGMKDFERALEGLQNFDEENEIGLFDDEAWLERIEAVKSQYDADGDESVDESSKKVVKKTVVKEDVDEIDDEEDDDVKEGGEDKDDDLNDLDRTGLKEYIRDHGLAISVKKSMTDDDIRKAIRDVAASEDEDDEDVADAVESDTVEEKPKVKVTLEEIRRKLAGK